MSLGGFLIEVLAEMLGVPVKKPPPRRQSAPPLADPEPASASQARRERPEPRERPGRRSGESWAGMETLAEMGAPEKEEPAYPRPNLASPADSAAEMTGARKAGASSELAARLRRNPAAARDAFIYSEIFAPPVGERRNWK